MTRIFDRIWISPNGQEYYKLTWCSLCEHAIIACEKCNNSSCNGSGCSECIEIFNLFCNEYKSRIEDYLTEEEMVIFQKCMSLKQAILNSLEIGNKSIDFKNESFCKKDEKIFEKEIKSKI